MVLFTILRAFWQMLEPRRRGIFVILLIAMLSMGVFEMAGMMMIFGFIRGISVSGSGERLGPIAKGLELVLGRSLSNEEFALIGGGLVLAVMAFKNLQSMLVRYHVSRFLGNLSRRVGTQIFSALLRMPYERMVTSKKPPAAVLAKTLGVFSSCYQAATMILADFALILMVLALLIFVEPWITLWVTLAFGGIGTVLYRYMQSSLRRIGEHDRIAKTKAAGHASNAFKGIVPTRLRDNAGFFIEGYTQALGKSLKVQRSKGALARVPGSVNEILLTLSVIGTVAYLVLAGENLSEALPILGVFGFAGMRAKGALSRINEGMQKLRVKADDFQEHLDNAIEFAPEIMGQEADDVFQSDYLADERPLPEGDDGRLKEELALNEVSFSYAGAKHPAVKDLSLGIPRGAFVSFCGESGSGKSTILLLLMGLLRASKGTVTFDGRNVNHHVRSWQSSIGYVGQADFLSGGTVVENVAFGVPPEDVDMDQIYKALELASAKEFVNELPKKEKTRLLDGGKRLSGGQRQRLFIARALYHDPDVVVFDEATAALDNVTEKEISDQLMRLKGVKTVICVAHRLSTIRDSDTIYFVHEGQVIDSGSYDELLKGNERFQRLANPQAVVRRES